MKKSTPKTIIKAALLTLGILSLIAGLINPLTYYFGKEVSATCDYASFTEISDSLSRTDITYHFFVSGKEYKNSISFDGVPDESISLRSHSVKYLPLFPQYNILTTEYSIPLGSIILASAGFIALITGFFVKTAKKEKTPKEEPVSNKFLFLCPACEREIDKDSIFCNYCGRKLLKKG